MNMSNYYPVTIIIILINCFVFFLVNIKQLSVRLLGSSYIDTIQNRQYYRVVTSAFTHKEFSHILVNMYSLYNVGTVIERLLGIKRYIIAYLLIMVIGGLIGARLHKKKTPFTLCIGASGVLCGLLGIYIVIAFFSLGFAGIKSVIPTILILILMTGSKRIDSIGHFTGLFVGIVYGIILLA